MKEAAMDWTAIIEKNRDALKRILAMLVAMAGGAARPHPEVPASGEPRRTLPRHLHRAILRLLRPAEAAARRLVIIAARDLIVTPPRPRPRKPRPTSIFVRDGKGTGIVLPRGVRPSDVLPSLARPRPAARRATLRLLDPLPRWPTRRRPPTVAVPRISLPGITEPHRVRRQPMPYDMIDATRLARRLQAIGQALDDLSDHARRFARWRMRAAAAATQMKHGITATRFIRIWPLRPGRPAGARRRPTHEVDEVLRDLHHFAFHALEQSRHTAALPSDDAACRDTS